MENKQLYCNPAPSALRSHGRTFGEMHTVAATAVGKGLIELTPHIDILETMPGNPTADVSTWRLPKSSSQYHICVRSSLQMQMVPHG